MEARRLVRHLKMVEREEGCLDTADAIVEWEHWCKNVTTVEGKIEMQDMFPVAADTIKGWSEVPESEYPVAFSSFQAAAPIPTSSLATLTLDCPAPNDHPPSKNMFTLICSLFFVVSQNVMEPSPSHHSGHCVCPASIDGTLHTDLIFSIDVCLKCIVQMRQWKLSQLKKCHRHQQERKRSAFAKKMQNRRKSQKRHLHTFRA